MSLFKRLFGSRLRPTSASKAFTPEVMKGLDSLAGNLRAQMAERDREDRKMIEHYRQQTERERAQRGQMERESPASSKARPSDPPPISGLVRYRGLTFGIDGEYSLVYDDKKVVRGIWYRDRNSIGNAARNRMVVAAARVNGLTVLDSDYETTIVGGIGGVEDLKNPGGAILWFDSTRELFGK